MRLRIPEIDPPELPHQSKPNGRRYAVELITPLYGGGVAAGLPDEEMPVRASAIRGHLRFWWRLLNRGRFADDLRAMFEEEASIWGGMGDRGATASRVLVGVSDVRDIRLAPCAEYKQKADGTWKTFPAFKYGKASGYALFPGQGKADKHNGVKEPPHQIIEPGLRFDLRIRLSGRCQTEADIWEDHVLPPLRWWASFGGLGARTRRGLGAVLIKGVDPVTVDEASGWGCRLVMRTACKDAVKAWTKAIERLLCFRQSPDGRAPGSDPWRPGRSRWPEADSLREITGCHFKTHAPVHPARVAFPRAVFGLPIITHFKDRPKNTPARDCDPEDTTILPIHNGEIKERMSSPVILKPMWTGSDYAPIALLLPHTHLARMGRSVEGKPYLPRRLEPPEWWPQKAQDSMCRNETLKSPPLAGRSGDVLQDFLDYFKE